ncbi:MAG: HIT domain-containing protein [Kiritimatiellae bacterium]|nr:HIT domain-containing protein [Kiritimatiellia bacterium]
MSQAGSSQSCVFCRIIAGELPANRLFEDEETLAFLDIAPIIKGHSLVVPRTHVELLTDAPERMLHRLVEGAQRVARAMLRGLSADGVNVFVANGAAAGQVVPHVHVHVIPRFREDGHRWNWAARSYATAEEARTIRDQIAAAL